MRSFSHKSTMRYTAPRVISFLVIVWMCCALSDALAQTDFDDITVTPELDLGGGNSFHGYAEYRIAVSNRSLDKAHRVALILPRMSYGVSGNHIREITRSVVVGPAATVRVSLLQPPVILHGTTLGVAIDGEVQKQVVQLRIDQHGRGESGGTHVSVSVGTPPGPPMSTIRRTRSSDVSLRILISRNVETTDLHTYANRLLTPFGSSGSSPSSGGFLPSAGGGSTASYQTIDLGLPVSAWSTSWIGFSRYDGVVITSDDVRQMPPDVQSALWRYVECGGALFVLGARELPESWRLQESLKSELSGDSVRIAAYDVGFGQCIVSPERDTESLDRNQWGWIVESWLKTAAPWQWEGSVEEANRMFPMVSSVGIPVRGLFLVMLLFAVAIGPANLIVLSRKRRRIWMLWTTPVISLITCLAVFAYATFAEGWKRHVRTEGLTILDERARRATTIGWTAFYSALTPGDGLHFGYETELTPQISKSMSTVRTVDWTHDQHLASGWVTARVPSHFMVRKSEMRRERVTVRRGADARLKVVNGLGVDIRRFWLADREGTIHSANDISAGEEAELVLRPDLRNLRLGSLAASGGVFQLAVQNLSIDQDLNNGNLPPMLKKELERHGVVLSDDVTVSTQTEHDEWEITDQVSKRTYTISITERVSGTGLPVELKIYYGEMTGLRGIFTSDNWIQNIDRLKRAPEAYLRPGCYIATLDTSPFIEEGLQKVTHKQYSAVVYGILAEE